MILKLRKLFHGMTVKFIKCFALLIAISNYSFSQIPNDIESKKLNRKLFFQDDYVKMVYNDIKLFESKLPERILHGEYLVFLVVERKLTDVGSQSYVIGIENDTLRYIYSINNAEGETRFGKEIKFSKSEAPYKNAIKLIDKLKPEFFIQHKLTKRERQRRYFDKATFLVIKKKNEYFSVLIGINDLKFCTQGPNYPGCELKELEAFMKSLSL